MVRLGIETLLETETELIEGDRIGLITNPSGVDSELVPTIDRLYRHDGIELAHLFGPEHGIRGDKQADVKVDDSVDEQTGLPVTSLYGDDRRLQPEMVEDLDSIVYDVQDIGCRFYTHIDTLVNGLQDSARAEKRFIVLDRPNPIAPLGIRGNRIRTTFDSFVGNQQLPITHGMTIGELARYFNEEFSIGADLHVVELNEWKRDTWYDQLELAWVPPSPNMPTLDTATIYPGTCLFEGTTLSEGRGTTKPFELIGGPWVDADEWATVLNDLEIDGAAFRPAYFSPMFSKHERRTVEGVQVHVMSRDRLDPVEVGVKMLATAVQLYPKTEWVQSNGEYFIDNLVGGPTLREKLTELEPSRSADEIYADLQSHWAEDRTAFETNHEKYALYE